MISLIFWVRLLQLSVIQLLGIIPVDDVVNTTKSQGGFLPGYPCCIWAGSPGSEIAA